MVGMSSMFPETGGVGDRLAGIERRLSALETAPRLTSASIGSGGLSIKGGGKLQLVDASGAVLVQLDTEGIEIFEADGSTLISLDGTGLRLNDAAGTKLIDLTTGGLKAYSGSDLLVQLNASGITIFEADGSTLAVIDGTKLRYNRADSSRILEITPTGGLKIYDTDGTTEKVVLDGTGLEVDGGAVRALNGVAGHNGTVTATLTATMSEKVAASIALPAWTQEALVVATATVQSGNSGTFPFGIRCAVAVDDVEHMVLQQDVDPGKTQSVTASRAITVANPTSPLKVSCIAGRNGGSGDQPNVACSASGLVIALR